MSKDGFSKKPVFPVHQLFYALFISAFSKPFYLLITLLSLWVTSDSNYISVLKFGNFWVKNPSEWNAIIYSLNVSGRRHNICVYILTSEHCLLGKAYGKVTIYWGQTVTILLSLSSSSSSPLCRLFILIFLRQTMSLGNTVLQLFCCYYSWCLYRYFQC